MGPFSGNRNRPAYSGQPRFQFPRSVIELFKARPALEYIPPPKRRKLRPMEGISSYLLYLKQTQSNPQRNSSDKDKDDENTINQQEPQQVNIEGSIFYVKHEGKVVASVESRNKNNELNFQDFPARRRLKRKEAKQERIRKIIEREKTAWSPHVITKTRAKSEHEHEMDVTEDHRRDGEDQDRDRDRDDDDEEQIKTKDPYKTLFVYRLPPQISELHLRMAFETFGRIGSIFIPLDPKTKLPRGYAFLEFEREKDLKEAYRVGDGKKILGQRISLDVERGRTSKGWLPKRLDGPHNETKLREERRAKQEKEERETAEKNAAAILEEHRHERNRDYRDHRDHRDHRDSRDNRDYRDREPRPRHRDRGGRSRY